MAPRIVAGRYQLESLLGEGGMAVVYRATDLVLHRTVAVKILRDQYAADPDFVERFQREARAAATLSHPNIVGVYDLGVDGTTHYIVMEYLEGENLKELIRREAPMPPARVVRIGAQIADALEYAHHRGIVHRDVKPQNILVTEDNRVKVMDFGIAAAAGASELTRPETVLGTAAYISPEQALGRQVGPPSDVYSAGLVLYEMATGRVPFRASNPLAVARMHVEDPPPRPSVLNPRLPRGLELIILRALSKDPARRFATAGDLARALMAFEAESDQFTQPDLTPVTQTRGWPAPDPMVLAGGERQLRRFPVPWVALSVLLLALVAVLAVIVSTVSGSGNSPTSRAVAGATPLPTPTATGVPTNAAPVAPPTGAPTMTTVPSPTAGVATSTSVPTTQATTVPTAAPATATPTARAAPSPTSVPATQAPSPTPVPARPSPSPTTRPPSPAVQAAVARVAQTGYSVSDPSSYDESQQLRVLIGSAGPNNQKAFFFLGDTYLGTDTLNPSAQIAFGGEDGNVVTIVYSLYRPQDPMDRPTGGKVGIQYQWNGSRLVPLEPIPPEDPSAGLSRR